MNESFRGKGSKPEGLEASSISDMEVDSSPPQCNNVSVMTTSLSELTSQKIASQLKANALIPQGPSPSSSTAAYSDSMFKNIPPGATTASTLSSQSQDVAGGENRSRFALFAQKTGAATERVATPRPRSLSRLKLPGLQVSNGEDICGRHSLGIFIFLP